MGGKLLSEIKSMYADTSACVRVNGDEIEQFRIDSRVKQGMGKRAVKLLGDGREWRLPGLLYADDLVLYGEPEKDLRVMVRWFAEVCRRRGLKVNVGKRKVMVVNGDEGLV